MFAKSSITSLSHQRCYQSHWGHHWRPPMAIKTEIYINHLRTKRRYIHTLKHTHTYTHTHTLSLSLSLSLSTSNSIIEGALPSTTPVTIERETSLLYINMILYVMHTYWHIILTQIIYTHSRIYVITISYMVSIYWIN